MVTLYRMWPIELTGTKLEKINEREALGDQYSGKNRRHNRGCRTKKNSRKNRYKLKKQ